MYKYKAIGKKINLCIIFCVGILYIIGTPPASAQTLPKQYLSITPIIQDITLTPKMPYSYPLLIANLADKPMGIHIDINGFDPSQQNSQQGFIPQSSPLTSWTTVSQTDTIIPPLSKKQIIVTITAPKTAHQSGYYETFTITPFISQQQTVKSPIILTRFLAVVFATVGKTNYNDLTKKIVIEKFAPLSSIFGTTQAHLLLQVNNNYFTHFIAKPFLTLYPLFGPQQTQLLEERHIFPGSSRQWDIALSLPSNYIFYKAQIAVSVGNGNQLYAYTYFVVLPNQVIIAFFIAFLLITLTLLRKRLWKFIKTLITG